MMNENRVTASLLIRDLAVPLSNIAFLDCQIQKDLLAYTAKLEAHYTSASEHIERLTPSLLAKAFRGELVSQEGSG